MAEEVAAAVYGAASTALPDNNDVATPIEPSLLILDFDIIYFGATELSLRIPAWRPYLHAKAADQLRHTCLGTRAATLLRQWRDLRHGENGIAPNTRPVATNAASGWKQSSSTKHTTSMSS